MNPPAGGITFVIPVLNGARTLRRAIASIAAPEPARPLEIIAIDDGSVDVGRSVLDERHIRRP